MALIKCRNCGHNVSDRAAACPKCGAPVSVQTESLVETAQTEGAATAAETEGTAAAVETEAAETEA